MPALKRIHPAGHALAWLLLALLALACAGQGETAMPLARVEIGGHTVLAEVPLSQEQRMRGLGGRQSLEPGRGMLFLFTPGSPQYMCMRDMNFPLDFIWLDQGRVSQISARVPAAGATLTLRADRPVQMVLEVPAGWAQAKMVRPGQKVRISAAGGELPPELARILNQEGGHETK